MVSQLNGVSLQAIYKYDIASHVPIGGEISFAELAGKCLLDEGHLRRILRFAMAFHHVFQEPRKGFVAHSAASRKLAEDPLAQAGLGFMFDDVWQSFARVCWHCLRTPSIPRLLIERQTLEAMEKFKSDEPNETVSALRGSVLTEDS